MIRQGELAYTFKIFSLYPQLVAAVTTKKAGNFLPLKHNDFRPLSLLTRFGIDPNLVVLAEQIHGSNAAWVHDYNARNIMKGFDGLITSERNLFLLIQVADCVPLLFYDPVQNFVAAAHSGWQGALQKISLKIAQEFVKFGSNKENILVALGPAICKNHYDAPEGRARLFDLTFGKGVAVERQGNKTFLDLTAAAKSPLLSFGILEKNIETSSLCAFENSGEFYSFRREKDETGRFAAIIGIRD